MLEEQCYEAKEDESDDLDNFDVDAWIKAVTEKEGEKVVPYEDGLGHDPEFDLMWSKFTTSCKTEAAHQQLNI